jgi:hypothetical protein
MQNLKYALDDRKIVLLTAARLFWLFQIVWIAPETHPAFFSMSSDGSSSGNTTTCAWSWQITPTVTRLRRDDMRSLCANGQIYFILPPHYRCEISRHTLVDVSGMKFLSYLWHEWFRHLKFKETNEYYIEQFLFSIYLSFLDVCIFTNTTYSIVC